MRTDHLSGLGPGSYVLIFELPSERVIEVGKLGRHAFPFGFYAYVGSALGPGGLAARVKHHLHGISRPHWHIDYLREVTRPDGLWFVESDLLLEHAWAGILPLLNHASQSMTGFGSSDCKCQTHLFHFRKRPSIRSFQKLAGNRFPNSPPVRSLKLG